MAKLPPRKPPMEPVARPVVTVNGEILGQRTWYPAVLPMSGIDFEQMDFPIMYVFANTNKGGARKNTMYSVKAVTATGGLVVNGLQGIHNMQDFTQALTGNAYRDPHLEPENVENDQADAQPEPRGEA